MKLLTSNVVRAAVLGIASAVMCALWHGWEGFCGGNATRLKNDIVGRVQRTGCGARENTKKQR